MPYEMTPFRNPEANAAVANRTRLEAWGSAALLICGMGYRGASHLPEKCFGCERSQHASGMGHQGKQDWSTRFHSASAGRCRGFGERKSSAFILYSGLVSRREQGDIHSPVRSSSPTPACWQLRMLSQQPHGLFDPLPNERRLLISSNNRDVCSSEIASLKTPQTNFS